MTIDVRNRQRARRVNVARLTKLASEALAIVRSDFHGLSVVLVGDSKMAQLNRQYHQTTGTTDILTFDYGAGQGELVISVQSAMAQARQFRTTPSRELALYVVHGILHLHGYNDTQPAARQRMRAAERRLLAKLDFRGLLPVR